MKKMIILLGGFLIIGSIAKINGYCFYNNSDPEKDPESAMIDVMVFKNSEDASKLFEGAYWTDATGKPIGEVATEVGEAVAVSVEDPRAKAAGVAVGAVGKLTPLLGDVTKRITLAALKKARHTLSTYREPGRGSGEHSCWNWKSIRKKYGDIRSMYFIVFEANGRFDNILFQGPLDIRCGLSYKGKGEVVSTYPFYNKEGERTWAPYEKGKEKGWTYISWEDYLKKGSKF